jgi:hypothetical protein
MESALKGGGHRLRYTHRSIHCVQGLVAAPHDRRPPGAPSLGRAGLTLQFLRVVFLGGVSMVEYLLAFVYSDMVETEWRKIG